MTVDIPMCKIEGLLALVPQACFGLQFNLKEITAEDCAG